MLRCFYEQAKQELSNLEDGISGGDMVPLKEWLNRKVHRWGRQYTPEGLVRQVTGQSPSPEPFLKYLEEKFSKLYRFFSRAKSTVKIINHNP